MKENHLNLSLKHFFIYFPQQYKDEALCLGSDKVYLIL